MVLNGALSPYKIPNIMATIKNYGFSMTNGKANESALSAENALQGILLV